MVQQSSTVLTQTLTLGIGAAIHDEMMAVLTMDEEDVKSCKLLDLADAIIWTPIRL